MSTYSVETLPQTGVWNIDPIHSTISFSVRHHAVSTFRAGLRGLSGSYDAAARKLRGEVTVKSIDVGTDDIQQQLYQHLQSAAFFDAENHPVLAFESTSIEEDGDTLAFTGSLSVRGVARTIKATGEVRGPSIVGYPNGNEGKHLGLDIEATIDRRDFSVSFNNELPGGELNLGWDVLIEATLELMEAPSGE